MMAELIELAVVVAWLWVGISNYLFTSRLTGQIGRVRAEEAELMKTHGLDS